jgi:hypothetical protein
VFITFHFSYSGGISFANGAVNLPPLTISTFDLGVLNPIDLPYFMSTLTLLKVVSLIGLGGSTY